MRALQHPLAQFVLRELEGTAASAAVYIIVRGGKWLLEWGERMIPLRNPAAAEFLQVILSWGAVMVTAAVWVIVTLYELGELLHQLRKPRI